MSNETDSVLAWIGYIALDEMGDRVGKVSSIYADDATGQPEWLGITTGLCGPRESFVPLAGTSPDGDTIRVPSSKDAVINAPSVEPDGHLEPHEEERLYRHYGLSSSGMPDQNAVNGHTSRRGRSDTHEAATRLEALAVHGKKRQAGRGHLRKYLAEEVDLMMPVRR